MAAKNNDKTDPLKSEGARRERASMRAYLRRKIRDADADQAILLTEVLKWVLTRQSRYKDKEGGL